MPRFRTEGTSRPEEEMTPRYSPEWLGFGLIAFFVSGALAVVATVLLVVHYPTPVDDVISIGFFGFLFVMFLDFALIYSLGSKVRKGQRLASVKRSVALLLPGLLVATESRRA